MRRLTAWLRGRPRSRAIPATAQPETTGYRIPHLWSDRDLDDAVAAALDGGERIVVGPWLSEVGYEVLYWIPFLQWLTERFGIPPERVTAISRGGVASWYRHVAADYVELFDLISAADFRRAGEERIARQANSMKQFAYDPFDRDIVARVAAERGWGRPAVLHPSLMYRSFNPYWGGEKTDRFLAEHMRFRTPTAPDHPVLRDLPERFCCLKFYERRSLPATARNRSLVDGIVGRLAERSPVVVFDGDLGVDDHAGFGIARRNGVVAVDGRFGLRDNLAAQSAVMARATATYGTYGGMIYVPLLYGGTAVGLYSDAFHLLDVHGNTVFRMTDALGGRLMVGHVDACADLLG